MSVYLTNARNFSVNTENRIHSDSVAARFGFEGALVPGAAVFGHMTHPLVDTLGPEWLAGSHVSVRFLKPAYDGDALTVTHDAADDPHTVRCHARGILLAELHTRPLDPDDGPANVQPGAPFSQRPEIEWDNVTVGEPFPAWKWLPDAVENAESAAQVEDSLACYRTGGRASSRHLEHGQPRLHPALPAAGVDPRRLGGALAATAAGWATRSRSAPCRRANGGARVTSSWTSASPMSWTARWPWGSNTRRSSASPSTMPLSADPRRTLAGCK